MKVCLDSQDNQQSLCNYAYLGQDIGDSEIVPPSNLASPSVFVRRQWTWSTNQMEAFPMQVVPSIRHRTLESRCEDPHNHP